MRRVIAATNGLEKVFTFWKSVWPRAAFGTALILVGSPPMRPELPPANGGTTYVSIFFR
jgi:hypothetical protein